MKQRRTLSFLGTAVIIIILGFIASTVISHRIDTTQRELLLVQAKHAALLVSQADIASLSGTTADLSNPVYQRLKGDLTAFRSADPQIQFVYVMGYHPEVRTQFFYVDSESTDSSDYSPPGQLFPDTREEDIEHYLAGEPYTDGPYEDSWGKWVSGYVPIIGASGETIALVGIDVATSVWQSQIAFARTSVIIIAILAIVIALFITKRMKRKQRDMDELAIKNQKLEKNQAGFKQLQALAHLGSMTIYFTDNTILVDEQFRGSVKADATGRISLDAFLAAVHPDDQDKYTAMIAEIKNEDTLYSWADVRIGSKDAGYRKYHLYGNIKRRAGGEPERFDGIMQDITDIEK